MNATSFNVEALTQESLDKLTGLLEMESLPVSDLNNTDWLELAGIVCEGELIAAGGIEKCGDELLLRSLVVSPSWRGKGLGKSVVENLHAKAHTRGYKKIYLLTLDAEQYFSTMFNYTLLDRDCVPVDIANSSQFSHTCPGSASLMVCAF